MALENTSIEEAVQDYLAGRTDLSQSSIDNDKHRLSVFADWTTSQGITRMNEATARVVHDFKVWRSEDVAQITLRMQFGTVRRFLRWGERMNMVPDGVGQHMEVPKVTDEDEVRAAKISEKEAEQVPEYLKPFDYASFDPVKVWLMWHTGCRLSTLHAFDVGDFHPEAGNVETVHRLDTDTPLKNRKKGQWEINLKPEVVRTVQDWLDTNHPKEPDKYGRMPLLGTDHGRAHVSTIRDHVYMVTRPCVYARECPRGRDVKECEAVRNEEASTCPGSHSPQVLRKGSITYHRNNSLHRKVVSDRADVSEKVLDPHYDMETEAKKRERRREFFDNL